MCNLVLQIPTQLRSCVTLFLFYTDFLILCQGELAHRLIKSLYTLTNKKDAIKQITKHEARRRHFQRPNGEVKAVNSDLLPTCDPELHHFISDAHRNPVDIFSFLQEHEGDSAVKVPLFRLPGTLFAADCIVVLHSEAEGPPIVSSTPSWFRRRGPYLHG